MQTRVVQLFPCAKDDFPVRPKDQTPGTIFENKYQIFVIFNNTYSEKTNYHISRWNVHYYCS
jgi:hypothetical protein